MTGPSPSERKTDEELAREARVGSRRSFDELTLRYKRRLFVYLRSRLGSDEDAEDMVQETFLRLYRNIHRYDPAFRFSTWLYTSAKRLSISSYRKKTTEKMKLGSRVLTGTEELADDEDAETPSAGLWEAARALGETRFRVLWLRYGEDLTVGEIAESIGKSRLAVRVLLHRARTGLMKRVGVAAARAAAAPVGVRPIPHG